MRGGRGEGRGCWHASALACQSVALSRARCQSRETEAWRGGGGRGGGVDVEGTRPQPSVARQPMSPLVHNCVREWACIWGKLYVFPSVCVCVCVCVSAYLKRKTHLLIVDMSIYCSVSACMCGGQCACVCVCLCELPSVGAALGVTTVVRVVPAPAVL